MNGFFCTLNYKLNESSIDQVNILQHYVIANLHVVSTKGKPKVKDLFCFIKCMKRHALVDYEKSEYLTREVPSNANLKVDGSFVDKYIRLVLKDSDLDLFPLNDLNWVDTCFVQKNLNL